ncbi:MAG: CHAT domain-containing protein [Acidobacteriales bacterium]|nr:CHAT domain-containing protein [Terriglobales bacterium]
MELVSRRKAIEAEALAAQRDAVLGGKYPALQPQLRELTTMRIQIAQKILAGPGREGLSPHQQLLAGWNAQREKLEAELTRQVPEMNLERKLRAADCQAVTLALPERVALVEFVHFNVFDFNAIPARGESQWKPTRYLAFVLPAEEPDKLQMIDLGEAAPIDQMIATFRAEIIGEAESRGRRDLGALPSKPVGEPSTTDGTTLRAALFDPLLRATGNRKRLLLAPDGDLTRLPFEVLPTHDGRHLIDDYQISYLSTGRDVLRFGAASSGQPTESLVAADPDFDLSGGQAQAQLASETVATASRGRVSRDLDRGTLHFDRLPGTRVEGERIAEMLNVQPRLADQAVEAHLKACRSPRILHLATHGFFLADQQRDPNKELRDLGAMGWQAGSNFGRMSGPGMENPLLRSGLALAGANTFLKHGTLAAEAEDGILTAEDVSGMDLLATELAVLSACETGLGEVRTGEGVFGLRRAFVLAGAKTLVMSLWKVPDEQTRELMEDFYRRILAGEPRAEALREARLAMKRKYPEPYYWGAFICQGDPSPLPRHASM